MYPAFKIEGLLSFFLASQSLKNWEQYKIGDNKTWNNMEAMSMGSRVRWFGFTLAQCLGYRNASCSYMYCYLPRQYRITEKGSGSGARLLDLNSNLPFIICHLLSVGT